MLTLLCKLAIFAIIVFFLMSCASFYLRYCTTFHAFGVIFSHFFVYVCVFTVLYCVIVKFLIT